MNPKTVNITPTINWVGETPRFSSFVICTVKSSNFFFLNTSKESLNDVATTDLSGLRFDKSGINTPSDRA